MLQVPHWPFWKVTGLTGSLMPNFHAENTTSKKERVLFHHQPTWILSSWSFIHFPCPLQNPLLSAPVSLWACGSHLLLSHFIYTCYVWSLKISDFMLWHHCTTSLKKRKENDEACGLKKPQLSSLWLHSEFKLRFCKNEKEGKEEGGLREMCRAVGLFS